MTQCASRKPAAAVSLRAMITIPILGLDQLNLFFGPVMKVAHPTEFVTICVIFK
jgi:hypothetical protein